MFQSEEDKLSKHIIATLTKLIGGSCSIRYEDDFYIITDKYNVITLANKTRMLDMMNLMVYDVSCDDGCLMLRLLAY